MFLYLLIISSISLVSGNNWNNQYQVQQLSNGYPWMADQIYGNPEVLAPATPYSQSGMVPQSFPYSSYYNPYSSYPYGVDEFYNYPMGEVAVGVQDFGGRRFYANPMMTGGLYGSPIMGGPQLVAGPPILGPPMIGPPMLGNPYIVNPYLSSYPMLDEVEE